MAAAVKDNYNITFELLNFIAAENMVKGIREQINKLEVNDIEPASQIGMHTIWVKQGSFAEVTYT